MTTIVYRDGVVAADGRAAQGDWLISDTAIKLYRMPDGSVAGLLGVFAASQTLARFLHGALLKNADLDLDAVEWPKDDKDGWVAWFRTNGAVITIHSGTYEIEPESPWHAFGSGGPAARGALHHGATAEKAVHIAGLCNLATGGRTTVMRVDAGKSARLAPQSEMYAGGVTWIGEVAQAHFNGAG